MVLLLTCIVGLLILGTSSSAVAQTLTSNPAGTVYCNGSEVIFTCVTRGSDTHEWSGDNFYVGGRIDFVAELHAVNFTRTILSNANTIATLTQNYLDGDVRVLVSTLRIIPLLGGSSDFVMCSIPGNTGHRINFQVLGPPVVPQDIVAFRFENFRNMNICAIASVLPSPTNPAGADAINYTVNVDGARVPEMGYFAVLHESDCSARNITISAKNMCGQTDEITLDPMRVMINTASNIECSVTAVVVGVVLVAFKCLT